MANDLEYTLGLQTGPFDQAADKLAGGISKKLAGTQAVATALGTALGLNLQSIATRLARFVTQVSEESEAAYKKIEEAGDRAVKIYERLFELRRGESQSFAGLEEKNNKLLREQEGIRATIAQRQKFINEASERGVWLLDKKAMTDKESVRLKEIEEELGENAVKLEEHRQKQAAEAAATDQKRFTVSIKNLSTYEQILALATRESKLQMEIEKNKGKGADLDLLKKQLAETTLALEEKWQERRAEGDKRALEIDEESSAYVEKNYERLQLEAKLKLGTLLPAEKARLDILRMEAKLQDIVWEKKRLLETLQNNGTWTEAEKQRYASLALQTKQLEAQIGLKQQLIGQTNQQAAVEKSVAEEIHYGTAALKSFVEEWTGWKQSISTTGRGDRDLSDRELAKKIKNINQALFESQVNRIGRIGVGNERGEDPFGFINQNNLSQALAEQRLRATTRRNVAAFGEERAFAMFGGSEQSFARILRESQDNSEQTTILRNIETALTSRGIRTVPIGT